MDDDEELTDDYGQPVEPQDVATTSPLAVEGGDVLESQLMAHHSRIAQMRQQQFEEAKRQLQQQRMGPGLAERLFALSAAFAAPQYTRGFSGMMANVAPVLAKYSNAATQAEEGRASKLQELRNKYLEGGITGEGDVLDTQLELAKLRAKKSGGNPVWSESLQRFVPRDEPVIVGTGVVHGQQVFNYSDGTMRIPAGNGTFAVYDAGGRRIGTSDAKGNPIHGATP